MPSIPAQANQVALLDIIASLLSNQILRELKLKLTTLLKTLFLVVIVVVIVAIVVVTIEGLLDCRVREDGNSLLYQVINLVLYYRNIGVKVPLVYSILNSNT